MRITQGIAGLLLLLTSTNLVTSATVIRTVALSDEHAPGTPDGVQFNNFGLPVINSLGRTVFSATLIGDGVDNFNFKGIWSEDASNLDLVARAGEQASGASSGVNYSIVFGHPLVDDSSRTAFEAILQGTGVDSSNNQAIFFGTSQSLALVARSGQQAPGLGSGVDYHSLHDLALSSDGHVAFRAELEGSGVDSTNSGSLWLANAGTPTMIVRTGDPAPGVPDASVFSFLGAPAVGESGQLALSASASTPGPNVVNRQGLWSGVNGALDPVVLEGDPVPGAAAGVLFRFLDRQVINASGQTAFDAFEQGPGFTGRNAVWLESSGSLSTVVREGEQAPGTPEGVEFSRLLGLFSDLNSAGELALFSSIRGPGVDLSNRFGIWSGGPGSLTLVARAGDHAPGTPNGVNFRTFLGEAPALNNNGHIAFRGIVLGEGVDHSNEVGIWAQDTAGVLRLVARTGDLLEVAPGDTRTIEQIEFVGTEPPSAGFGQDHRSSSYGFNDSNQLAFLAGFTDGTSGVFVSNLVAIPEPGSLLLALIGTGGLAIRRKRHLR